MKKTLILFFISFTIASCTTSKDQPQITKEMKSKFELFINKKKFYPENHYPGIMDSKLRPLLSKKINEIAINFMNVAKSNKFSDENYLKIISTGLNSFKGIYLDTEDREKICSYIEELMDIVNLESSNGLLNKFMYNFNIK